jgi:hypothetical protein
VLGELVGLSSIQKLSFPLEQAATSSLEALQNYTAGAAEMNHGRFRTAVPWFERAVALDPHFAGAYRGLGAAYYNAGDTRWTPFDHSAMLCNARHQSQGDLAGDVLRASVSEGNMPREQNNQISRNPYFAHSGRRRCNPMRHSPGRGIVAELMRDNASGDTDLMTDLMEVIGELSNERLFATRSRQEEAIVGKPFQRAKRPR